MQQIQCNCPEREEVLRLGRKRHGAAQREGRKEESCFQAAAGGQPGDTRPGWGELCGGRDGRGVASRAWTFRCGYRCQWKCAASASRRSGGGGRADSGRADGGGADGGRAATGKPGDEPAMVQPSTLAVEYMAAVEPMGVGLSVPATQAAATAPAADAATTVRLVSEALSGLALELAAAKKPTAGVLTGKSAAVEPAAATAARRERPVLANGPVAASKECWVLNPGVGSKVIVKKLSIGLAAVAAEAAATEEKCAGEPVPEPGSPLVARRAAAETESPPVVTAPEPVAPMAAAAPVKRKAKAGVTGGSQKRKKSSPVKIKDL